MRQSESCPNILPSNVLKQKHTKKATIFLFYLERVFPVVNCMYNILKLLHQMTNYLWFFIWWVQDIVKLCPTAHGIPNCKPIEKKILKPNT